MDPELGPGEHLYHWTDNWDKTAGALDFSRYTDVRFLLIGVRPLVKNEDWPTTEGELSAELKHTGLLRNLLGTRRAPGTLIRYARKLELGCMASTSEPPFPGSRERG